MHRFLPLSLLLLGCQPVDPDREGQGAELAEAVDLADGGGTRLPRAAGLPLEEGLRVEVSPSAISFDGEEVAEMEGGNIDPASVQNHLVPGLYGELTEAVALAREVARERGETWDGGVIVAADRATTFAALVDVLYTAGRAEIRRYALVVEPGGGAGERQIPVSPPEFRVEDGQAVRDPVRGLSIHVIEGGYTVGRGSTVLTRPTAVRATDFESITHSAAELRREHPDARTVVVSAEPGVRLDRVVGAMAAARGKSCQADGTDCLLPDVIVLAGDPHGYALAL